MAPLIVEGDVLGTDDGTIRPGSIVVFSTATDVSRAKLYLGASWDDGPVAALLFLRPAPWIMRVRVDEMTELRRVPCIYRDGAWIVPDTAAAVSRAPRPFLKGVHRVNLLPFGGKVEPLSTSAA